MEVSEKNEIVVVDKNENVRSEDYGFPFYQKGTTYGLTAGAIMGAISLIISSLVGEDNVGWDFVKYLALGLVLGQLLNKYKSFLPSGKVFKDGMVLGMFTSFVAAVTMAAINLVVSLFGLESGVLQKFGLEVNSFMDSVMINGLMIFECLVFGLILTFVWLQLLKDEKPAE
ncbi:hypothetical protein [Flavilitoribacter nigricans]|uniref:DUF4199 domain-containing protein n=1 Tax=Flavilitoribacter nigricans (strain ATCC 23147 / DSM 23189 / NBRC 102662 / NCIMB 1420 / SS-2) TaxID=1122177 RepID=A0A2D0NGP7_FLAN2|nr:hypothetical protein [Flavilitoribacter nigricans]PHN07657.1 hypothetical protein CRP01_06040 [Flavilitoribacter nigricans DSM 23189 = NBRC 102662]